MLIKIGDFDCMECWYGVFYKKLSAYPKITKWEIQTVLDFISYELKNGRKCHIDADNQIINTIEKYKSNIKNMQRISVPDKITECTACPTFRGWGCKKSPLKKKQLRSRDHSCFLV